MRSQQKIQIKEKNLKFWQSGLILSSGLGLTSMFIGGQILKEYGAGTAFTSVFIGNLVLWFIGFGIISMTEEREHVIQNIKGSLGKFSAGIAAIVIVGAFLIWFALHIKAPSLAITTLVKQYRSVGDNFGLRVSGILGITCALVGVGGIKSIKWINIISFPILLFVLVISVFGFSQPKLIDFSWGISLSGVLLVVLTWLPGTINLSTFFRHSRSKADSILGLTLTMILHIIFQCCFVFLNASDLTDLLKNSEIFNNEIYLVLLVFYSVISFFCVNLLNIYWASVGWEVFFMQKQDYRGYAIIGLIGTVIYMFFQSSEIISFLEKIGTTYIANLGVVLIASYLVKIIIRHRPRRIDKFTNSICWLIGCCVSTFVLVIDSSSLPNAFILGINSSLLSFGFILFLEEVSWSAKQLP